MRSEEFTLKFETIGRLEHGQVPASLAQREKVLLYALVFGLAPSMALELGTFRGGSAAIISGALQDLKLGGHLLCVEPEVAGIDPGMIDLIKHNTEIVQGFFPQAMPETLDGRPTEGAFEFCFYDADHTYEGVKQHLVLIRKWMAPGSFVLCHDGYHIPQAQGIADGGREGGYIDCGMLTRCANDVSVSGELYGGMRLLKVPGELPFNS